MRRKLIDWKDYFTSIDESMDEVLYALNHIIYRLDMMLGRVPTAQTQQTITIPIFQWPPAVGRAVIALPPNLKLTRTLSLTVSQKQKITLQDDYFVMTPDDDVIIYETENAQGFKVRAGAYYGLSRSPDFSEIWVEPTTPSTNIYLSFYKVIQQ